MRVGGKRRSCRRSTRAQMATSGTVQNVRSPSPLPKCANTWGACYALHKCAQQHAPPRLHTCTPARPTMTTLHFHSRSQKLGCRRCGMQRAEGWRQRPLPPPGPASPRPQRLAGPPSKALIATPSLWRGCQRAPWPCRSKDSDTCAQLKAVGSCTTLTAPIFGAKLTNTVRAHSC